ncbi:MAG: hypothetical protein AAFR11_05570 [Pseudomonadota bacterium]
MNFPEITDHALLRYAERVLDVDIPAIRRHMEETVGPQLQAAIAARAASCEIDGVRYCFKGGKVVTVLTETQACRRGRHLEQDSPRGR